MPRSPGEVLRGPATFYVAPVGTAFPIDPSAVPAVAWIDIGYTDEGVVLTDEPSEEEIDVEEEIYHLAFDITMRDLTVEAALAQASLDNIQRSLGGTIAVVAGPPATRTWTPATTSLPPSSALLIRGPAPEAVGVAKVRDVKIPKAYALGATELSWRKGQKQLVPISFRVALPTSGAPYTITDLT